MGHLTGKVAIVTGSGANIGEACVRALAKAGALVVLADINIIGAERVAEEINSAGGTAFVQHPDLAAAGSIQAIIDDTISRFKIGREPCRERVWKYDVILGGG